MKNDVAAGVNDDVTVVKDVVAAGVNDDGTALKDDVVAGVNYLCGPRDGGKESE